MTLFNFSFAYLIDTAERGLRYLRRDLNELSMYNVTNKTLSFMSERTLVLRRMSTDEMLVGDIMLATDKKNKAAKDVINRTKAIIIRIKSFYGSKSVEYKSLKAQGIDSFTHEKLYTRGCQILGRIKEYQNALTQKGMTDTEISEYENALNDLLKRMNDQYEAMINRELATEKRAELANELYTLLVEVFGYGKLYWRGKNEKRCSDYVIYHQKRSTKKEVVITTDQRKEQKTVNLAIEGKEGTKLKIDWGNGTISDVELNHGIKLLHYEYETPGVYTIVIKGDVEKLWDISCADSNLTDVTLNERLLGLNSLQFQDNLLVQESVDKVLETLDKIGNTSGELNLSGELMNQPSLEGNNAKYSLEKKGWEITLS